MWERVYFTKPVCKEKSILCLTPRNQFHWIVRRLILIFKAKKINLNQYVAGLESRIQNESTVCSSEHGFLNDTHSVFSLYEGGRGGGAEGGREEGKGIAGI